MSDEQDKPLDAVGDGNRGKDGKFLPGNQAGRGNPHAQRAQQLRSALFKAVGPADLKKIIKAMIEAAIGGDVQAARLILDRVLGQPVAHDFEERLAQIEDRLVEEVDDRWPQRT